MPDDCVPLSPAELAAEFLDRVGALIRDNARLREENALLNRQCVGMAARLARKRVGQRGGDVALTVWGPMEDHS